MVDTRRLVGRVVTGQIQDRLFCHSQIKYWLSALGRIFLIRKNYNSFIVWQRQVEIPSLLVPNSKRCLLVQHFIAVFGWHCMLYVLDKRNPKFAFLNAVPGGCFLRRLRRMEDFLGWCPPSVLYSGRGACAVATVWPTCLCVVAKNQAELWKVSVFVLWKWFIPKKKKEKEMKGKGVKRILLTAKCVKYCFSRRKWIYCISLKIVRECGYSSTSQQFFCSKWGLQ